MRNHFACLLPENRQACEITGFRAELQELEKIK
jgi:hypothetical protein